MQPTIRSIDSTGMPSTRSDPHALLLAEYIHRSANDFAIACAEINGARRAATFDGARDRLAIVGDRLLSLAAIQRLLQVPGSATMDLGGKLCELSHHHAQARFVEKGIFVRICAAEVPVDSRRGGIVLMIVSELLTNAARHAFASPGGMVDILLTRCDGEIRCRVADDGIGIPPARAMSGSGSAIITALALEAGIQLSARACPVGTSVELRMPIELAVAPGS